MPCGRKGGIVLHPSDVLVILQITLRGSNLHLLLPNTDQMTTLKITDSEPAV